MTDFSQHRRAPIITLPTGILDWQSHWTCCRVWTCSNKLLPKYLRKVKLLACWLMSAINRVKCTTDALTVVRNILSDEQIAAEKLAVNSLELPSRKRLEKPGVPLQAVLLLFTFTRNPRCTYNFLYITALSDSS